jgi:hypothetical protein
VCLFSTVPLSTAYLLVIGDSGIQEGIGQIDDQVNEGE